MFINKLILGDNLEILKAIANGFVYEYLSSTVSKRTFIRVPESMKVIKLKVNGAVKLHYE
ncbi:MAG: hypothetical protein LBS16_04530 [Prevotellaceae bacterium]|jgi:hypothetical protein|nr:hypothetical protein [Prevotellaceae bacterium]